jgi:hypothetical protein
MYVCVCVCLCMCTYGMYVYIYMSVYVCIYVCGLITTLCKHQTKPKSHKTFKMNTGMPLTNAPPDADNIHSRFKLA